MVRLEGGALCVWGGHVPLGVGFEILKAHAIPS